ncbi:MAG TPA: hypothetical protein VJB06_00810, partial [archaeon]|nr:hypothetical protein [archaeon]
MAVYSRARLSVGGEVIPVRAAYAQTASGNYKFDVIIQGGFRNGEVHVLQPDGSRGHPQGGRLYYSRQTVLTLKPDEYRPPADNSSGTPVRVTRKGGIEQGGRRIGWVANKDALSSILEALTRIPDEK